MRKFRHVAGVIACIVSFAACPARAELFTSVEQPDAAVLEALMQNTSWREPKTDLDRRVAELVSATARNEVNKLARTTDALARQRRASLFAFYFAHVLLLLGIVLGLLEFLQAYRLRSKGRSSERIELSFGLEGIALKCSLSGVLLLVVFFAFYLAFLTYVYPLRVLEAVKDSSAPWASSIQNSHLGAK